MSKEKELETPPAVFGLFNLSLPSLKAIFFHPKPAQPTKGEDDA